MEVTNIRLRKVETEGRMRAIVSITLDDAFVVHDLRVIDGNNGLFVAMPSKRTKEGEFRDVAHPINMEMRAKIQDKILAAYAESEVTEASLLTEDVVKQEKEAVEV
ncbi:septation regulator SpoVG [Caryophanon latum]|mgnify:FL=1|uniref:Putative septation protein SpoVG n=1 Tax=Caryophanon latum TaxID=33977 RepID=A0A1C0YYE8_9BACL|nr:septation regulator SpoVG [Caryophanon latum]OCS92215.1 septation protein SpoVG [Caryophanon latum]